MFTKAPHFISNPSAKEKSKDIKESPKTDGAILLIGPTGSGKSTFGNFLLQKDEFHVGHGGDSCTDEVSESILQFGKKRFSVIDTPGLYDSRGGLKDTAHLI